MYHHHHHDILQSAVAEVCVCVCGWRTWCDINTHVQYEGERASESYMYHKIGVYLQLYCVFVYLMLQSKIQAFLCVSFSSLLFMLAAGSQARSLRSSSKLTSSLF